MHPLLPVAHLSANGQLVELEHAHGSVPDDSLAGVKGLVEGLHGVGANVKTHPAIGNSISLDSLQTQGYEA